MTDVNGRSLFPRPRRLEWTGTGAPADADVRVDHDPALPAQGYGIVADAGVVVLTFADAAGRRYGERTLAALREPGGWPGVSVRDHPDVEVRGYMLDVSRDRVPTMETLEWLVGILDACRINQLQLYTEHTFAYRDHEVVWRDASPMTADEMRALDDLCDAHGIELVANQNCFGHMERWLRHPEYRDRAECPDGWTFPVLGGHVEPATLEPTPDNAAFALGLVRELMDSVASARVNIGCDETFELGMCRSAKAVTEHGKAAVFCDHLLRLLEPLISEGADVQFWGDMIRRDPDLVSRLPRHGATALAWSYEAPGEPGDGLYGLLGASRDLAEVFGLPDDAHLGLRAHARPFAERGYPFWVAPGTSTWNSLIGRWANARANLLDAAETARAPGAGGVLITDWGDNGHFQPPVVTALPLAYGAAVAWCADSNRDLDAASAVDHLLGDSSGTIGRVLRALGDLGARTGRETVNGSPLFMDLFAEPPLPVWGEVDVDSVREVVSVLDATTDDVERSVPGGPHADAIRAELLAAVALARHGARRMLVRAGAADADRDTMRDDLVAALAAQRTAWLARSRPGGLDDSLARLGPTLAEYA